MASGVLAIVAVGSASAIVAGPRMLQSANEDVAVRAAVHAMVSDLTGAEFATVKATYGGGGFDIDGLKAVDGDKDGLPGEIHIETVGTGASTLYKVTFTVKWQGMSGDRTVSSVHYISNVRADTAPTDETPSGEEGTPTEETGQELDPVDPVLEEPIKDPIEDPIQDPIQDPMTEGEEGVK